MVQLQCCSYDLYYVGIIIDWSKVIIIDWSKVIIIDWSKVIIIDWSKKLSYSLS